MHRTAKLNAILSILVMIPMVFTNLNRGDRVLNVNMQAAGKTEHVPGVILVGLKAGITLEDGLPDETGRFKTNGKSLGDSLKALHVHKADGLFPAIGNQKDPTTSNNEPVILDQVHRLHLPEKANLQAAIQALLADPDVEYAEPDYIAMPADVSLADFPASVNDPLYAEQWGLAKINIEAAWAVTSGSPGTIIAIVDSGIDRTHIDLAAHLWVNPGEIPNNSLDDDNNGYVDDVNGWNFVGGTKDVSDDNGHGTLVAGVAAAIANNSQGIAGVCPDCSLLPVKVMQPSGVANYSDIAAGVLYAAVKGAKVINLSLGGYSNSNTLQNAINTAVNTFGVVVVAGAGNDNLNQPFYPAAYDNVLGVAGSAADDTKLDFSNYGSWVDVSAPAKDIRTTALGGDWANGSGTSVAAPFAAGLAGLLRTLHPDWSQATIRSQIVHTTDSIESLNPSYAGLLGSGRLNAGAALQAPHPLLSMAGSLVNGQADGRPLLGATASLNVTLQNDWWDALGVTGTLTTTDPYVTMVNGSASYGDIPAGTSSTNPTAFTFTVDSGAGYNHPIPFSLNVSDTGGYSNYFDLTVNTESGVENKSGTIPSDETWSSDKTYLITGNVNIPTGVTLTIQPGTTVKFNGNYNLNVRGNLLADGSSDQPIVFKYNTTGTWGYLLFDDTSTDASADIDGNYLSGSILRYVNIESSSGGIDCTTATPYLSHLQLEGGGVACSLGATPIWLLDSSINGGASFTGTGSALRNTITGNLGISGAGTVHENTVSGSLTLGSGTAIGNTTGSNLTVGGSGGSITDNTTGGISAGISFDVQRNTTTGSLTAGDGSTVDHNTVSKGITVGNSAIVTWNNVENNIGVGLNAGSNVTAQYNRLVGNASGMTASTGLIEHNLIANNTGVGLQVGAATVRYNTLTGNGGNTILVQGGNPVTIEYNNLEGNTGTYDLYVNIPGGVFVFAQHNWWGISDNLVIAGRIYDWNDDDTKATASYTLKLTEPDQSAPAYVRGVTVLPDSTLGIQTGTFQAQFSKPMDVNITALLRSNIASHMPTARSFLGVATAGNGRIYAIGGYSAVAAGEIDTVEEYDPVSNTWATRASMPSPRSGLGVAAGSNGKLYVMGGTYNNIYPNTVEEYDPVLDSWRTVASMPTARMAPGVMAGNNGKIYVIGGASQQGIMLQTVEEYDPLTDTWRARASMPTARCSFGVAAASNGRIYAIGGYVGTGSNLDTVEEYDPVTDTWSARASMPTIRSGLGAATAGNGRIYAVGGTNSIDIFSTVEEYYPVTNTWQTHDSIPTARTGLGVTAGNNGMIYAIGGADLSVGYSLMEEVRDTGVDMGGFYDPKWLSDTQFQVSYDITSLVPKGSYQLLVGYALDSDGMRIAPNSNTTFMVDYAGFISDKTPPDQPLVTASGDGSLKTISANWSSSDPESPITTYRYAIGTTLGGREVVDWTYTTDTIMTRDNLNLTTDQAYFVVVQARNEGGLWSLAGISNGIIAGVAPTNLQASDGAFTSKVQLSWNAISAATTYKVYRAIGAAGAKSLLGNPTTTTFDDTTSTPGITYTYWVTACKAANCSGFSTANTGWRNLSAAANLQASDGTYTGKIQLCWNTSLGATSYKVYRSDSATGTKNLLNTSSVNSFADTTATTIATYYYWVTACRNTRCSGYSAVNAGWRNLTAPGNLQASDGTYTDRVQLTWDTSLGATSYKIFRATSSTGTKILLSSPTVNTFTDNVVAPGVTYYYWVKACKDTRCSDFSIVNAGWRNLIPPTYLQASDGTYKDRIQLTWNTSLGATSYNVLRSTSSTGTKTFLSTSLVNSYADSTAIPGITYYYWVRACRDVRCSGTSAFNTGWRAP